MMRNKMRRDSERLWICVELEKLLLLIAHTFLALTEEKYWVSQRLLSFTLGHEGSMGLFLKYGNF